MRCAQLAATRTALGFPHPPLPHLLDAFPSYTGSTLTKVIATLVSGIAIGLTAATMQLLVDFATRHRNRLLSTLLAAPAAGPGLLQQPLARALGALFGIGLAAVLVTTLVVHYWAPKAAGGGVALVGSTGSTAMRAAWNALVGSCHVLVMLHGVHCSIWKDAGSAAHSFFVVCSSAAPLPASFVRSWPCLTATSSTPCCPGGCTSQRCWAQPPRAPPGWRWAWKVGLPRTAEQSSRPKWTCPAQFGAWPWPPYALPCSRRQTQPACSSWLARPPTLQGP